MAVYVHRDAVQWLDGLGSARIHRGEQIALRALDRALVGALVARLERRMSFSLSVSDADLFVSFHDATISGRVTPLRM